MDFYLIRHLTKFLYANQVSESLMEARMHPRSDNNQRCLSFSLSVSPRCRVFSYRDHLGNNVHHFDIPGRTLAAGDRSRSPGGTTAAA